MNKLKNILLNYLVVSYLSMLSLVIVCLYFTVFGSSYQNFLVVTYALVFNLIVYFPLTLVFLAVTLIVGNIKDKELMKILNRKEE